MFPLKQKNLKVIYKMVAWVYLESRDLSFIEDEEQRQVHLKHHIGIHVAKLPRDVDIGWIPTCKRKEALRDIKKKLALTNDSSELSWLFHDLSKLLMEMHRFDWAR